jgi:hypothetical protein
MIRYHPHENVFFNRLAGEGMEAARQRFELDYWGLSYRQGLEWILRHDGRSAIKVFLAGGLAEASAAILPRGERRRLVCVARRGEADYFLGNYRWHRGDYPYRHSVYAVRVGETEIMSVYDLRYERWGVRRGRGGERSPRRSA